MEIRWCRLDTIDPVQREKIERHIIKLSKEKNDLIDVRIGSHLSKHHRHGDCQIRIKGIIRGGEIVVTHKGVDTGPTLNEAVEILENEIHRIHDRRMKNRPKSLMESSQLDYQSE